MIMFKWEDINQERERLDRFLEYKLDELAYDHGYVSGKHMAHSKNQDHISLYFKKLSKLIDEFAEEK